MTEKDPLNEVLEALMNASHCLADPVKSDTQDWYDDCGFTPSTSLEAITYVAKQAIERVRAIRVNAVCVTRQGTPPH